MSTTVVERILSRYVRRDQENDERELRFRIYNSASDIDDEDAELALLTQMPATFRGLLLAGYDIEPTESERLWYATVKYDKARKRETGTSEYSFDIGTQDVNVKQSRATTPYPSTAPNFNGAIGVTDKRVEGVDVKVPTFTFEETHYVDAADITGSYKLAVFGVAGKVNNSLFKGFAPGECLFLGCSGTQRKDDQWALTFRFAASPNVTSLTVGSITGIDKKGWEYLDIHYAEFNDTTANWVVKRPVYAYVHEVFELGDLSVLGIGT